MPRNAGVHFRPRTCRQCVEALADRRHAGSKLEPSALVEYYRPHLESLANDGSPCELLQRPQPGQWLAEHDEGGQTFATFVRSPFKATPHGGCDSVALVPLGNDWDFPPLTALAQYISSFWAVPVTVAPRVPLDILQERVSQRTGLDQQRQFLAQDLLGMVSEASKTNRDLRSCVAFVGVTMEDLFHRHEWNYVFGLADPLEGMGVFSLYRYDPGPLYQLELRQLISLHRSCKVMSHELGHLFGLRHCIYFQCLMNGSNHLEELDSNSFFLCPVCLAKILDGFRWNLADRYDGLVETVQQLGFMNEQELAHLLSLRELTAQFQDIVRSPPPGAVDWKQIHMQRQLARGASALTNSRPPLRRAAKKA